MLSSLIPVDPSLVPPWVQVWQLARKRGDMRVLDEQEYGYRNNGYRWLPDEGLLPPERRTQLEQELGQRLL
jgi:hypothetical protein